MLLRVNIKDFETVTHLTLTFAFLTETFKSEVCEEQYHDILDHVFDVIIEEKPSKLSLKTFKEYYLKGFRKFLMNNLDKSVPSVNDMAVLYSCLTEVLFTTSFGDTLDEIKQNLNHGIELANRFLH